MNDKMKTAIDMIAQGYNVEVVIDILDIDPEELFDILSEMLGNDKRVYVTQTIEHFHSDMLGHFVMDLN